MNEKTPTVSVIIPTYNRAHLVGRAIRSVLNQTFQDFEIIVVDDGSTDNTEEVVKGFNDPRIRYIRHEENHGGSAARNTGICAARGEYIAFLDADDEWLSMHLHRKLQLLEETYVDGLFGSYYVVSGNRWAKFVCQSKPSTVSMAEYILSKTGDPRTSTMVFRRGAVTQILFDETLRKHQDWDLAIRFEQHFKLEVDPVATVVLHSCPDSMSRRLNHMATECFLKNCWSSLSQETKARFCLLLAVRTFIAEGRSNNFRAWLKKAREVPPSRTMFKGLLMSLSIPVINRLVVWLLGKYFWFKWRRSSHRLAPDWRIKLELPPSLDQESFCK